MSVVSRSTSWPKTTVLFVAISLLVVGPAAYAQVTGPVTIPTIGDPTRFTEAYRRAMGQWVTTGQHYVTALFAVLAAADLTWFGVEYWLNRYDFEGMMMASIRKVFAVGFFLNRSTS